MSWHQTTLGEIAEIVSGSTPKSDVARYWDGKVAWATPTDLSRLQGKHITTTDRTISEAGLNECSARLLPPGSVLFSSRAPIGLVAINTSPMATNQGFKSFIPKPEVNADYLYWWLRANRKQLDDLGNGATFKEISKAVVSRVSFPLPPLNEQLRIATILDMADAIRRKRDHVITLAGDFLQSVFLRMFGDPTSNEKGLKKSPLGEIIKVSSGDGLIARNMAPDGIYPVYGGNGINGYHSDFMFEEPQIVIGRVGAYCGAVHVSEPKSWVTDNALYVREFKKKINKTYLAWALRFANLNQYAGRAAQPLISGGRIYEVEILMPEEMQQDEFEKLVMKHRVLLDKLSLDKDVSGQLFSGLSQRAFRGEI
ncbi:restriction endonuclease subunit S [Mesorhizobium sp. B2-3-14]|uniref:restriction endonuclease subunit S n=1 Tax=Mesorhizobium sp. B2-3-14 TaxID=2589950 RepID=UPI00112D68A4|nr:restriction endonuclease subunit S [Mesorhizobium sp. B2-3-14]TPL86791.1 restriction endonuclease subunit S [Mesorhizobium sp. B2-3-14]